VALGRLGDHVISCVTASWVGYGYRPKAVTAAEGRVEIEMPQPRQTVSAFQSHVVDFLERNTDVLERLVAEIYARGL